MKRKKLIEGTVGVSRVRRGVIWWSRPSTLSVLFSLLATSLLAMALTLSGIPVVWIIWYRLSPGTSGRLAAVLRDPGVSFEDMLVREGVKQKPEPYQPAFNPDLPAQNRLIIRKIGVETPIIEETLADHERALRLGVWRVPDFGDAFSRERPMILAAHRFGYLAWTNQYRRQNSFFNLPKLEPGDQVEVIWGQRQYTYQIYAGEEGEEITDYTSDLVLYTCKFLESPEKIFRYARLVEK